MDFEHLSVLFHGSLSPASYHGSLSSIQEEIESCQNINPDDPREVLATKALSNAVLSMIAGDMRRADGYLNDLANIVPDLDPRWQIRLHLYRLYKLQLQRYPPVLGFRVEHGSMRATIYDVEIDLADTFVTTSRKIETLLLGREQNSTDACETRLFKDYFYSTLCTWVFAMPSHRAFPKGSEMLPDPSNEPQPHLKFLQILEARSNEAKHANLHNLYITFSKLCLEMRLAALQEPPEKAVEDLETWAAKQGDWSLLAWCKMRRADATASPPFTSPIALNLIALDDANAGMRNSTWDETEDVLQLRGSANIINLYREAEQLYQKGGSPRGCAAIAMRLGCIKLCAGLEMQTDQIRRHAMFQEANALFLESRMGFESDQASLQLLKCHQILLDISSRRWDSVEQAAIELGDWGLRNANPIPVTFAGCLMIRLGRRFWLKSAQVDTAILCFRCAALCFAHLGDDVSRLQALIAGLEVENTIYNDPACLNLIELIIPLWQNVYVRLESMRTKENLSAQTRSNVTAMSDNWRNTLNPLVTEVLTRIGSSELIGKWTAAFSGVENPTTIELMETALRNTRLEATHSSQLTLISNRHVDMELNRKIRTWDFEFRSLLQSYKVHAADGLLIKCIVEIESLPGTPNLKLLAQAYFCYELGNPAGALSAMKRSQKAEFCHYTVQRIDLGTAPWLRNRYLVRSTGGDQVENAVASCVVSRDWKRGISIFNEVMANFPEFLDCEGNPPESWNRFVWFGLIMEHSGRFLDAFRYFCAARGLLDCRRFDMSDNEANISGFSTTNVAELYSGLARLCHITDQFGLSMTLLRGFRLGIPPCGTWNEVALVFLEEGKARGLRGLIDSSFESAPGSSDGTVAVEKTRLIRHLQVIPPEKRTESESNELAQLVGLLGREGLNSFERKLRPKRSSQSPMVQLHTLYASLRAFEIMLHINFCRHGLLILAVSANGILKTHSADMSDVHMRRLAYGVMDLVGNPEKVDNTENRSECNSFLAEISDTLIRPFEEILRQKTHIIFAASQPLTIFPFAILKIGKAPLLLAKSVSISPSLHVHLRTYHRRSQLSKANLVSIVNPKPGAPEMPLPYAGIEGIAAAHLYSSVPRIATQMSSDDFRNTVRGPKIIHVGTHGDVHKYSAWLSWIALKTHVRVIDIMPGSNNADLFVFAACLSGVGKVTKGGDMIGFAHVALASGCKSFLGSLWKVQDVPSMFVMYYFYQRLKQYGGERSLAEIWREAQMQLYHTTKEQAERTLEDLIRIWDDCDAQGHKPNSYVRKGRWLLAETKKSGLEDIDFKDPRHWGAYAIVGDGHLLDS